MRRFIDVRPIETTVLLLVGLAFYLSAPSEPVAQEAECGWGNGPICAVAIGCHKLFCWNIVLYYDLKPPYVEVG